MVTATHIDSEAMIAEGCFREDLFYRLKGMALRKLSLTEQPEDVALLAIVFLWRTYSAAVLTPDAADWLVKRSWPGQVREFRAMIEAAAALAVPGVEPMDTALLRFVAGELKDLPAPARSSVSTLAQAFEEIERRMLSYALAASGGNLNLRQRGHRAIAGIRV